MIAISTKSPKILKKYVIELNNYEKKRRETAQNLMTRINSLNKYKSFIGLMIGVEILKEDLRNIQVFFDFKNIYLNHSSHQNLAQKKINLHLNDRFSFGQWIRQLNDGNYKGQKLFIHYRKKNLYKLLDRINKIRNKILHHQITKYSGDLESVNAESRNFVMSKSMPLDRAIKAMGKFFNQLNK